MLCRTWKNFKPATQNYQRRGGEGQSRYGGQPKGWGERTGRNLYDRRNEGSGRMVEAESDVEPKERFKGTRSEEIY